MATIEIALRSLAQLFDALDPAPLGGRALDPAVERYIRARAGNGRSAEPSRLRVHLPESQRPNAPEAGDAIHEHFRRTHALGEWAFRRRLRLGAVFLVAALGILAASFWLRSLLNVRSRAPIQGLAEGLLILGWVSMWRPVEILLFEHWESHLDHAIVERLASIPLEFVFHPDAAPAHIAANAEKSA